MSNITLPYDINNGDALDADKVMANENAIVTEYNAQIGSKSGDVVTTAEAQTLTNKTYIEIKGTIKSTAQTITTDTDSATTTFDLSASNVHQVTLGGNRTLAISNATVGQYFAIELIQDGTASRTVTWFSTIKWVGGTAPTLTVDGAITVASTTAGNLGTGYAVGGVITITGGSGTATATITSIDGSGGITGLSWTNYGKDYAIANAVATTCSGTGTGYKVDITGVSDATGKKDSFMFRVTGTGTYDGYIVGMNI